MTFLSSSHWSKSNCQTVYYRRSRLLLGYGNTEIEFLEFINNFHDLLRKKTLETYDLVRLGSLIFEWRDIQTQTVRHTEFFRFPIQSVNNNSTFLIFFIWAKYFFILCLKILNSHYMICRKTNSKFGDNFSEILRLRNCTVGQVRIWQLRHFQQIDVM